MLRTIKNKKQYNDYLLRAYDLLQLNLKANSLESDELEILSILIEKYELEKFHIDAPNPIEAIKFRLEQLGMKDSELSKILGSRSRVSEIFSGKRKLSLAMIRKLNQSLEIPAEILIKEYDLNHAS